MHFTYKKIAGNVQHKVLARIVEHTNAVLRDFLRIESKENINLHPMIVHCSDIDFTIRIDIHQQTLVLSQCAYPYTQNLASEPMHTAKICFIEGTSTAIGTYIIAKNMPQSLHSTQDIRVQGDMANITAWQKIFTQAHIHWEEAITKRIGTIPASFFINNIHAIRRFSLSKHRHTPSSLHHYFATNQLGVTQSMWLSHTKQINKLVKKTQRLKEKIHAIENNLQ